MKELFRGNFGRFWILELLFWDGYIFFFSVLIKRDIEEESYFFLCYYGLLSGLDILRV